MKQLERRIQQLEEHQAETSEYPGSVAQWLKWENGEEVPEKARLYFEERRAVATAEVAAVLADFDDFEED